MLTFATRLLPRVIVQARAASQNKAPKKQQLKGLRKYNYENDLLYGSLIEPAKKIPRKSIIEKPVSKSANSSEFLQAPDSEFSTSKKKNLKSKIIKKETKSSKKKEAVPEKLILKETTIVDPYARTLEFPMVNTTGEILKLDHSMQLSQIPSVSRILNATMSEQSRAALERWKKNMIAQLGFEGFLEYKNLLLQRGKEFHSLVQDHLSGKPAVPIPELEGCWESLSKVLPEMGQVMDLESPVLHPGLHYKGIIDCVAEFRGEPMVIEWKKSDKKKPLLQYTYDAPLQMTAYIGAMNFDSSYPKKTTRGTVVVAYTDGSPADVFCLSFNECLPYWYFWLDRLNKYWDMQKQQAVSVV